MPSIFKTTALLAGLAAVQAIPTLSQRDVITALPGNADEIELRFQPLTDYDSDGCYQTAAVDPNGYMNPGKGSTGTPQGGCRDPPQLRNANTYSRRRCNNGVCAVMYEYYFEKDQAVGGSFLGGHRHDWENIVVFSRGDQVVRVAPSCHGKYGNARGDFLIDGTHPYMVYHKDGAGTHCWRFANQGDVDRPENPLGAFQTSALVGWLSWPNVGLRDAMLNNWSGGVGPKLDTEFVDSLRAAAGDAVPGFNPEIDE